MCRIQTKNWLYNNMKNIFILKKVEYLCFILIIACFLSNCVSFHNNPSASVNDRCLLEMDGTLNIKGKDGLWGSDRVIIPSGRQSIAFDYKASVQTSQTTTATYYDVYSANDIVLTYDFMPGHHYKINAKRSGSQVQVFIEDLGTNTSVFHNGVYTGVHLTWIYILAPADYLMQQQGLALELMEH